MAARLVVAVVTLVSLLVMVTCAPPGDNKEKLQAESSYGFGYYGGFPGYYGGYYGFPYGYRYGYGFPYYGYGYGLYGYPFY